MLTVARVVNKFPSFYGTRTFIDVLKTSRDFPPLPSRMDPVRSTYFHSFL